MPATDVIFVESLVYQHSKLILHTDHSADGPESFAEGRNKKAIASILNQASSSVAEILIKKSPESMCLSLAIFVQV